MDWLKEIVVDIFALVVIAFTVFYGQAILVYVVYTYTTLMVLARLFSLLSENFQAITQKKIHKAPIWIYHVIYAITVAILLAGQWYITAFGWVFIWISAIIAHKKSI